MLNIRIALLSVALLVLFTLSMGLMAGRPEVVLDPSSELASVLDNQERSANQNKVNDTRSYRPPLDECFGMSLPELASCRNSSQTPNQFYHPHLDECFDVSLSELASCRNMSQTPDQSYRPPLDECFDVSLMERASCRNASQALVP